MQFYRIVCISVSAESSSVSMLLMDKISLNFNVSWYNNRVLPIVDHDVIGVRGSRKAEAQGLMNLTKMVCLVHSGARWVIGV